MSRVGARSNAIALILRRAGPGSSAARGCDVRASRDSSDNERQPVPPVALPEQRLGIQSPRRRVQFGLEKKRESARGVRGNRIPLARLLGRLRSVGKPRYY